MKQKNQSTEPTKKKVYKKPVLKPLGDIRDVTMGGSIGLGDSGGGAQKPF